MVFGDCEDSTKSMCGRLRSCPCSYLIPHSHNTIIISTLSHPVDSALAIRVLHLLYGESDSV
jgi:ATP-dependent helicase YprA (DUF1998 family)